MPLQDPIAIYTAKTNAEAQLLGTLLNQAGIEAHVAEDESLVGLWVLGTLPGIHQPQIWVDRANAEKAAALLRDYEQRAAERNAAPEEGAVGGEIEATCPECGHRCIFPAAQKGTVQSCPECGAYLDVGEEEPDFDWSDGQEEEPDQ